MTAAEQLTAFAALGRWVLEISREEFTDVDAGELQEEAQRLGLLVGIEALEPCCDGGCLCAETGDFPTTCLRMVVPVQVDPPLLACPNCVDSLRVDVGRLERENREISSCVDGLRSTCQALLERVERLEVTAQEWEPSK